MNGKPERQSLANLPFERKTMAPLSPAEAAELEEEARAFEGDEPPLKAKAEGKDDKKPVMVRMRPADRKLLRQIALAMDTTVQALLEEAITDIIRRNRGAVNL